MKQAKNMPLFSDISIKLAHMFTVLYHPHPDIILSLHSLFVKLIVAHSVTVRLFPGRMSTTVKVHFITVSLPACISYGWPTLTLVEKHVLRVQNTQC